MAEPKPGVKISTSILPCFLFVELVIMAGTVLLAYYFEYTDTFPVYVQGFFCHDRTLSKPYPGPDEGSKVPPVLIYSMVSAIPTFTILAGELTSFFLKPEGTQEKTIVTADCCYFNPLLRRIVRFLGVYSFGLFTTTIFANAGQVVTGNQTPHFLSACRPNYTALGCHLVTQYITDRRACTGNPLIVASARKSFPSKDAALSFYAAVYIVMYVTVVFRTKGTRLAKPTVCLTLLSLAVLVGVVRVTEYRNHWGDVLAGYFTGGAIAVFLVTCVVNNFQQTRPAALPSRPPRPDSAPGMPVVVLPCVENPLEKLSGSQISDHQSWSGHPVNRACSRGADGLVGRQNLSWGTPPRSSNFIVGSGIPVQRDHMTISHTGSPCPQTFSYPLPPSPAKSRPPSRPFSPMPRPLRTPTPPTLLFDTSVNRSPHQQTPLRPPNRPPHWMLS
ncbi:phospholipid phosphatase-related protein type 5-like isoform X2 [Paramormyrops kingsleyae]|nr:phospholipid phosphatase-related protein type 5-like isoform X2 [Paramormyrops kingsleyae]